MNLFVHYTRLPEQQSFVVFVGVPPRCMSTGVVYRAAYNKGADGGVGVVSFMTKDEYHLVPADTLVKYHAWRYATCEEKIGVSTGLR